MSEGFSSVGTAHESVRPSIGVSRDRRAGRPSGGDRGDRGDGDQPALGIARRLSTSLRACVETVA